MIRQHIEPYVTTCNTRSCMFLLMSYHIKYWMHMCTIVKYKTSVFLRKCIPSEHTSDCHSNLHNFFQFVFVKHILIVWAGGVCEKSRQNSCEKLCLLPQPLSFSQMFPRIPWSLLFPASPTKQLDPTLLFAQVLMQKSHHTQQHLLPQHRHTCSLLLTHTHTHTHTHTNTEPPTFTPQKREEEVVTVLLLSLHRCTHTHAYTRLLCFLSSNVAGDWL